MTQKSNPHILPQGVGHIVKWEATDMTRVQVTAPQGTKAGALVQYPLADNGYFIALTDESDGKVLIQPLNCVVNTKVVSDDDMVKAGGYAKLQAAWFKCGVMVDGTDRRALTLSVGAER